MIIIITIELIIAAFAPFTFYVYVMFLLWPDLTCLLAQCLFSCAVWWRVTLPRVTLCSVKSLNASSDHRSVCGTKSFLNVQLHQFLGLEEALEVLHLPDAGDDEDERLSDGPPQDALVGALAGHAESLLAVPLIVLLLLNLFNLI